MPHNRRTITLAGAKLPITPMGTELILFRELAGTDGVNEPFDYTVTCYARDEYGRGIIEHFITAAQVASGETLAVGSQWDVESLIGSAVTVTIEQDGKINVGSMDGLADGLRHAGVSFPVLGAGQRHISAIVTEARYVGTSGRFAQYELRLRPWFTLLTKNRQYRVFQHQSAPQIIDTVLKQYPFPVETRLVGDYPELDMQIQFGQSDAQYVEMLMQEWGMNYWFEHADGKHVMIISDGLQGFKPMDSAAYQDLFVYPPDLKLQEEYVSDFIDGQVLVPSRYMAMDYQFKQNRVTQTSQAKQPHNTAFNHIEVAQWVQGHFVTAQGETGEGDTKAKAYMEALRQHGRRAQGKGNVRGVQVGHTFTLHNHPRTKSNIGWTVLTTNYHMVETLQASNSESQFTISVSFTAQPSTEQVRPERTIAKPTAHTQTATIVGPKDKEIWVDAYGRVKVKFHWDRYGTSDENASCWVRVASPWSGMNYGGVAHPRIGQEVTIDFISFDGDMPYVSGRVTNPTNMPLWELPTQHMLSGFKSKEIGATRNNYLIMDDTKGEIQTQLGSDQMSSQLNLGYLTRIPSPSGRQDYRGQGFEVRTDAWGAIRAAKGMMLSTHSRADGASHIKDLSEILSALKGAHSQHKTFAQLAIDHKADERTLDQTAQTALNAQNEQIAGSQSDADKFPELTSPHLLIGSPAGVELVTPQNTHIATGQHIAITSHADTSISAKRIAGSVARGISLFTRTIGQKWFAAKGKVEIQAQTDRLDMIAEKVFKIISTKGSIEFAALEEILATAGGSYIKINKSGIEHGTPMDWKVWAGSHGKPSAKELPYKYPTNIFNDEMFILKDPTGKPVRNFKYKVTNDAGDVFYGTTNKNGETQRISSGGKVTKLKIMPDDRDA